MVELIASPIPKPSDLVVTKASKMLPMIVRWQARSIVGNDDFDGVVNFDRANGCSSDTVTHAFHGFERVEEEIHEDLLDLHPIGGDDQGNGSEFRFQQDLFCRASNAIRATDSSTISLTSQDKRSDSARREKDRNRLQILLAPVAMRSIFSFDSRKPSKSGELRCGKPIPAGFGVVENCIQRLAQFVGDFCRQFADGGKTSDVGQLHLHVLQLLFGPFAFRDIDRGVDDSHDPAVRVHDRVAADEHGASAGHRDFAFLWPAGLNGLDARCNPDRARSGF